MKKIFVFLLLMVVSFVAKSQYPITQNLGADSTLIYIKGAARTVGGFINGVYTDTAAANLTRIRQYQAAQIFTLNDSAIWFRMPGANKWVRIMPATPPSPNVDTAYWSLNGNYVADRVATPRLGTTSYHELNMITNDTIRATISADGIQRVSGGQYRALVIDTTIGANGYLGYMDNGTGTINSDSLNNYWRLTGNSKPVALPDTSKILGTIDTSSIYFRTNNYIAGYIKNAEPLAPYYMRGTGAQGVAYGSHAGENGFKGQWPNTNTLIGTYAGRFTRSSANIFVGFHAGYLHTFGGANGGRNVAIGEWAMNNGYRAYDNVAVGAFALNNNWRGISNTGVGRDAFKSSSDANGLVGVGAYTGLYNSTGVKKVVITNSGSGYTTATITISAPGWSANGGNCSEQATATAVIQGGQIVDAIITNPGCGYWVAADSLRELGLSIDWPAQTVTITGDGVGATASLEFINNWANTYVGGTSGVYRRFSAYETAIGSESAGASRYKDTANTFLGYQADVDNSVSLDSNIHRSTAVGQNAKVTKSDQMVLGATTQKDINAYGFLNLFNTTGNSPTIGTNANRSLWFRTNSTNRMELDSLGRLFIGQRPSYYNLLGSGHGLNYRNTFAIFDLNQFAIFGRATGTNSPVLHVIDSTTSNAFRIPVAAMSTPMLANEYSSFHFGKGLTTGQSGALSYLYSGVNSPENKVAYGFYGNLQMWLTNSGRFGFGTSVPSYGFHINKTIGVNKDSIPITTGKLWYQVIDTATGQAMRQLLPATGVDSIWRVPGIDSFYHRIAGVTKAIKDSTGGGTYTAGNGLTLSGSQFKLGGTLTENTTLTGNFRLNLENRHTSILGDTVTIYSNVNNGIDLNNGINNQMLFEANGGPIRFSSVSDFYIPNPIIVGTVPSGASTDSILTLAASTGQVRKRTVSDLVSTPTLQEVLTAGSTLTTTNEIYGNANSLLFDNFSSISFSANNVNLNGISSVLSVSDSILLQPNQGILNIDSLHSATIADTLYKKPMTWDTRNGRWEYAANWPQQKISLVFGAGSGADSDTTAFTTSAIYGSFYNDADTIVVTSMRSVLQGTSPDITYKVWYNDSLNVEAGATALVTAGSQVTNTTTGTNVTSFDVTKIPPGVWVWVKTSTVATKPKYFSLTVNGYRK